MTKLLKTSEVMELLNLSQNKVLDLVNTGELQATRLGPKTIRIYADSVEALIKRGEICN